VTRTPLIVVLLCLSGNCAAAEISRVAGCFGDILRVNGDIQEGDYIRFRSHFSAERKVIGVELDSGGGSLDDGFRMARLAHAKGLPTYVSNECDSACAFIFLASRKRYVAHGAKIGVHSVGNVHGTEDAGTIRDTIRLARLSAKLGVPPSTIGRMVTTPPGKIAYLDQKDLSALKVVARDPFRLLAGSTKARSDEQDKRTTCAKEITKPASPSADVTYGKTDALGKEVN
jgi:hypothetical protein